MENMTGLLETFHPLFAFSILFGIVLFISFLIRWIWKHVLIKLARKTTTMMDERLFRSTRSAAQLTFIALGFNFAWQLYGTAIIELIGKGKVFDVGFIKSMMDHFCFLFMALSILIFTWKAVFAILEWYEKDIASKTDTRVDDKIIFTINKIMRFLFTIVVLMVLADHYSWPISKLWAMAGIGSLAIAFAAQETIANLISGVTILLDRPFLVGDRIELTDGTYGDVTDIGLRSTKILSIDNTLYVLPNAEIAKQRITNHTYPDITIKVTHNIGVAYGTDLDKVKAILNDILANRPEVLNDPPWKIWFLEFGDSSLNFMIKYWIGDYMDRLDMIDIVNMEINKRFAEESIQIPFPQRDIHIIHDDKS